MPTVLDGILEAHEGPEPRVITEDVQEILRRMIRPGTEDGDASVALIAEKARVSTRTVYRVLNPDESKHTISLDLADKLCLAAGSHVSSCRLLLSSGVIVNYRDV
jgi:hypothetical protein